MSLCKRCGGRLHRSRTRNRWESLRRLLTHKRPYRCHACHWREWGLEIEYDSWSPVERESEASETRDLDLDALDSSLRDAHRRSAGGRNQIIS